MAEVYRALVVEDDAVARDATVTALHEQGFACTWADDGVNATSAMQKSNFDVVVTDLRMPRRNGHALAVELSQRPEPRPLVIVLTGVLDPRLVKDLIARGVDDVAFKPVDFTVFGAKVRALCDRHRRPESALPAGEVIDLAQPRNFPFERIPAAQMERQLDSLAGALPVSEVALEVAQLVQEGKPSAEEVAKAISLDPLLTVEVLRLANSARIHPAGRRIENLQEAVTWVGDRQIGELAMASTTLGALSKVQMPWMDSSVLWRRSLASSRAIKLLQPAADVGSEDEGLFLSSLVAPISRIVLSLAFPGLYEKMVAHCRHTSASLAEVERQIFTVSPGRAMAGILARWNLAPGLCKPLHHAASSYSEISALTEPLRSKVERLRVAEFLGQLAVGQFEPWCEIDIPPSETIARLRMEDPAGMVEQIRAELSGAPCSAAESARPAQPSTELATQKPRSARYFKLTVDCRDLLAVLLQAMDLAIERVSRDEACQAGQGIVNCLDVSPERLEWFLDDAVPDTQRVLITNNPRPAECGTWSRMVELPCSFQTFSQAVLDACC